MGFALLSLRWSSNPSYRQASRHYGSRCGSNSDIRDLKIYDAAARRRGFITKDIFIEDNSQE